MSENSQPEGFSLSPRQIYIGLVAVAAVVAILLLIGASLRQYEPNYYAKGRSDLVNARLKLEEVIAKEKLIIEEKRLAHTELLESIKDLSNAIEMDPEDHSRIEEIRKEIQNIFKLEGSGSASAEESEKQYKRLLSEIESLINKVEKRGKHL